jgi:uncharacterized damage-inducible protein DinB
MTSDSDSAAFPEPTTPASSTTEVFLRYLDYFRSRMISKVAGLPDSEVRTSRLPSGWTPAELVKHIRFVEMRWLEWGFEGQDVADPWGDRKDGKWHVAEDETIPELLDALRAQGERTREILEAHDLSDIGQPSDRWDAADPPTLERVCFHLVQEYARHVGHLDIVCELATGQTGE